MSSSPSSSARDIAVIGMACRFPDAPNLDQFWQNSLDKKASFKDIDDSRWSHSKLFSASARDADRTYAQCGALLDLDLLSSFAAAEFNVAPRRAEVMDPQHRLFLETSYQALLDAGVFARGFDRSRTGVFVGASVSEHKDLVSARIRAEQIGFGDFGENTLAADARQLTTRVASMRAFAIPGNLLNLIAATVAQTFDLQGPAFALDAACASALVAIVQAVQHLRGIEVAPREAAPVAIAGGVYLNLTPDNLIGFSRIGAIAKTECRPFDAQASGFILGEGVGTVILKRLDHALRDGDRIYCVIKGAVANSDGCGDGPMAPRVEGQHALLSAGFRDAADVSPQSIAYIECHGTATGVGDATEMKALNLIHAGKTAARLGSVKANVGHTMSASGVAGFIRAAMAVYTGVLPPQASFTSLHPAIAEHLGAFEIATEPGRFPGETRRATVSSFGFGGTNAFAVLESAPLAAQTAVKGDGLFVLSAFDRNALRNYTLALRASLTPESDALGLAYTHTVTRPLDAFVAVFVADTAEVLGSRLESLAKALEAEIDGLREVAPGIFAGPATEKLPVVWMFPGQGAQAPNAFKDVAARFPQVAAALREETARLNSPDLWPLLFPESDLEAAAKALQATEVCQPAIAALELGVARFLGELGGHADAMLGHSLGELVAASVAGRLDASELMHFVRARGLAISEQSTSEPSSMLAVRCGRVDAEPYAARFGLEIANANHPEQTVLGGATGKVEEAVKALKNEGIAATQLKVSHAFHTSFMKTADEKVRALVALLPIKNGDARVTSAVDAAAYPADKEAVRALWARHMCAPVDFIGAVESVAQRGRAIWLQLGPGNALAQSAAGTLKKLGRKEPVITLGVAGKELPQTLLALGLMRIAGQSLDLPRVFHGQERVVHAPERPLPREKYFVIAPASQQEKGQIMASSSSDKGVSGLLGQVFQQQLALLQQQTQLMNQQALTIQQALGGQLATLTAPVAAPVVAAPVLAASVGAPVVAAPVLAASVGAPVVAAPVLAASVGAPVVAAPVAPQVDIAHIEDTVFSLVAKVSAFPRASLNRKQSLGRDLGFDSLMMVELASSLRDAFTPHGELDREIWAAGPTVGTLIDELRKVASGSAVVSTDAPANEVLHRYAATWHDAALHAHTRAPRKVWITGERTLADALAKTLASKGDTRVDNATEADAFAHVAAHAIDIEQLRQTVAGFAGREPAYVLLAESAEHTGAGAAAEVLALEWPKCSVHHVIGADATQLAAETESSDRRVKYVAGARQTRRFSDAHKSEKTLNLSSTDTVLITGGASGVGLWLARAAAARGANIVLVGRSRDAAKNETAAALKARYISVDVNDRQALRQLGEVKPTVLIHAAGTSHDVRATDLDAHSLAKVWATKVSALESLLHALPSLRAVVATSSFAGVFGNHGQFAYAAANEAMAAVLDRHSKKLFVQTLAYPPWRDTGLAKTIPSFLWPELEKRGVKALDPATASAEVFTAPTGAGHFLVATGLPKGAKTPFLRWDLTTHPYVADHKVKGVAILPFASALDAMAPAQFPVILKDARVHEGLPLPASLKIESDRISRADGKTAFSMTRGTVLPAPPEEPPSAFWFDALPLDLESFYTKHTFHGSSLRGIEKILHVAETAVEGIVKTSSGKVDPLAVDSSFQLGVYWAQAVQGKGALPLSVGECVILRQWTGTVRARLDLSSITEKEFSGTIRYYRDSQKPELIGWMRDVHALLLDASAIGVEAAKPTLQRSSAFDHATPMDIPAEHYRFDELPAYKDLKQRLDMAEVAGVKNPYFTLHERVTNNTSVIGGREVTNYSSYNYLGLSGHPDVSRAASEAITRYGTSVSASRVASGEKPLHRELEAAIARMLGTEDSIVMVGGHATNVSTIGHIVGPGDLILHDQLIHDSCMQGAKLSGAQRRPFPHNDAAALERILALLRAQYKRVLIIIEGVYSMDGDIADLPAFVALRNHYKCWLMVDEAHSLGVLGKGGRGIGEHFGIDGGEVDMWMGTLSKSLSSCGGYIAGTKAMVEYLKYTNPGFVYSVGISPPNAASALASIQVLEREPLRVKKLHDNASLFVSLATKRGLDTGLSGNSAVIPVIVGNSFVCIQLAARLLEQGINVNPIIYPAVEDNAARLRFFMTSEHSAEQIRHTVDTVSKTLADLHRELGLDNTVST